MIGSTVGLPLGCCAARLSALTNFLNGGSLAEHQGPIGETSREAYGTSNCCLQWQFIVMVRPWVRPRCHRPPGHRARRMHRPRRQPVKALVSSVALAVLSAMDPAPWCDCEGITSTHQERSGEELVATRDSDPR